MENHYHVTKLENGSVYGHSTDHCDENGCAAGADLYLTGTDPAEVELHHVYEITAGGAVVAEVV